MKRIEMHIGRAWHDVTALYVPGSMTISESAMNGDRQSSVSTCSFRIRYDQRLDDAVLEQTRQIPVRVSEDMDVVFDGYMDPVMNSSWEGDLVPSEVEIECVDFSVVLDEDVRQSASYPSAVDGPAFWIYRGDVKDMSILYRLLEEAGLADRIAADAPDIDQKIQHVAWSAGSQTYRSFIDGILADYGWCLVVHADRITWVRTACASLEHVDDIGPEDIVGQATRSRSYITENGASVEWSVLKVMEDALLWRGDLPIGDTANPRPGELIASDDYWPEDSDIIDTWQNFGVEYLDVKWLRGETRLHNDELSLVSSSNWVLKDKRDEEVVLDPVAEGQTVVYEALRARLRYHNTSEESRRLYYSQINGKALVKTHKVYTTTPEGCSKPEVYRSSYIYDKDSAERLARIRWMWMTKGNLSFTFTSRRRLVPGGYYMLHQGRIYDGFVQIVGAVSDDGSDLVRYVAWSTSPFLEVATNSSGAQGSGGASPGQDGATNRYVYRRSYNKPETPVGDQPEGWTFDVIPEGVEPVWMSTAKFASTGNLIGGWTEPIRVTGIDKGAYRGARPDFPDNPADGDYILYTGPSSEDFTQYHFYKFVAVDEEWVETHESDKVMSAQYDALKIAKETGELIYAAMIVVELLVARKLMVGGGTLEKGLLMRVLDDDGSVDHKPVIEILYDGKDLFRVDVDTGRLYGNFARVVQYMPFTFNDSVDSSHPAVFDFYIPEGEIEYVQVRVRAQKYRTYSLAGPGTLWSNGDKPYFNVSYLPISLRIPSHTHSVSASGTTGIGGSHSHGGSTGSSGSHSHRVSASGSSPEGLVTVSGTASDAGSHSHSISTYSTGDHTHGVSVSGSTGSAGGYIDTFNVPSDIDLDLDHSHDTLLAIVEAETASNMSIAWSDGDDAWRDTQSISSGQTRSLDINSSGWKSIRVASSTRGRVQVQVIVKIRIDTKQ